MKIYVKYIAGLYLKYIFILFVALECFYVGVDVLTNLKDFPASANLALLYVTYTALVAVNYTLPLSLIFALIITMTNMIRSNELICLHSLGLSKNALITPPLIIALLIAFIFVGLNSTPFVYALDYQKSIQNMTQLSDKTTKQMFLKYEDKFVFMGTLNAVNKKATNLRILKVENDEITEFSSAKKAEYNGNKWTFSDVNHTKFPSQLKLGEKGYENQKIAKLDDLQGFDPKSLEKVYDASNSYSIIDAWRSIKAFKSQNIDIKSIKAALYSLVFSPFFAPFMLLILYYFLPYSGRFFNLALLSFIFFIVTLCAWGVQFVLTRFSLNGVIIPELGIILPIALLGAYGGFLFLKHQKG